MISCLAMQPAPKPTESDETPMSSAEVTPELNQPKLPFPPGWEGGLSLPQATYRTIGERRAVENPKSAQSRRKPSSRTRKKSIFSLSYWFDGDTRREIRLWMDARDFRMWAVGLALLGFVVGLIIVLSEINSKPPSMIR